MSSFGIGGTNAHVILEEAPETEETKERGKEERPYELMVLSAKTRTALDRGTANLAAFLKERPGISLGDVAYTLQQGRQAFEHRRIGVCSSVGEAVEMFSSGDSEAVKTLQARRRDREAYFIFPGYGAQYENMGRELYETERVFGDVMDRCFAILDGLLGCNVKEIIYPGMGENGGADGETAEGRAVKVPSREDRINIIDNAQPLLVSFEYALTCLLSSWGIKPKAMLGYSLGEYVAATVAGVFGLEDVLKLLTLRGQLMKPLPPGIMLSVPLSREDVLPRLGSEMELALHSSARLCVVSGVPGAVEAFEKQLAAEGVETTRVRAAHAYHSRMMEPILDEFEEALRKITLNKPRIPYVSNLTADWIRDEEATDPVYWRRHIRETVGFNDALGILLKQEDALLMEVGPGRGLTTFARQHDLKGPGHTIIDTVRHPREPQSDAAYLLDKVGQLWASGGVVDWDAYHAGEERKRVSCQLIPSTNNAIKWKARWRR